MQVGSRLIGQKSLSNFETAHLHLVCFSPGPSNPSPMQWLPPAAGVGPCKLFRPSPLQPGRHSAVRLQWCTCAYKDRGRQYRYPARCTLYFGHAGSSIQYAAHYGWKPASSISSRHGREIHVALVVAQGQPQQHPVFLCCACSYFESLADPAPIYRVSYL